MATVVISRYGTKEYRNDDGDRHREDGPAEILRLGTKIWWHNGDLDRIDMPSVRRQDGIMLWNIKNDRTRINGPCEDYPNGRKLWYKDGKRLWPLL